MFCLSYLKLYLFIAHYYNWMLHMPKRLTPHAKRDVEVEKNDKILYIAFKFLIKQVRTNIGLADTLIHFSFINFSYMGGTDAIHPKCDSSKIIFGSHVYS